MVLHITNNYISNTFDHCCIWIQYYWYSRADLQKHLTTFPYEFNIIGTGVPTYYYYFHYHHYCFSSSGNVIRKDISGFQVEIGKDIITCKDFVSQRLPIGWSDTPGPGEFLGPLSLSSSSIPHSTSFLFTQIHPHRRFKTIRWSPSFFPLRASFLFGLPPFS